MLVEMCFVLSLYGALPSDGRLTIEVDGIVAQSSNVEEMRDMIGRLCNERIAHDTDKD